MNKKVAFGAGFVSGNVFLIGSTVVLVKWKQDYIVKVMVERAKQHVVFRYFDTLLEVIKDGHGIILDDPRLQPLEDEIKFDGIVKDLNIRER